MRRGRRVGGTVALLGGAAALAVVVVGGVFGVSQTVGAGTQPSVCGTTIGVAVAGPMVRLLGASDRPLAPGDRVRLGPLCVVEIVNIEDVDVAATGAEDADGGGARVELRWRLW